MSDPPKWLRELFPRKQGLAILAKRILEALDDEGYLRQWGWTGKVGINGFTRWQASRVMKRLVKAGYVEPRDALVGRRDKPITVYVRCENFLEELKDRANEMTEYRKAHDWWSSAGMLKLPGKTPPTGNRNVGAVRTATKGSEPRENVSFNRSNFSEPDTLPKQEEKPDSSVFRALAERLGGSIDRAKEAADQWAKENELDSAEEAARMYLTSGGS